jgi:hypothetical protein
VTLTVGDPVYTPDGAMITVTARNAGGATRLGSGAILPGAYAQEFTIQSDGCANKSLPTNGSCTISVRWTRKLGGEGKHEADLSVRDLITPGKTYSGRMSVIVVD